MKRPASQYYWGDWRRDTALQSCSLTARGLWHEMNCLMHDCDPYGHLLVGSVGMRPAQLARLVGVTEKECATLLAELEAAGVFSRTAEGVIYSRRMVRDEALRELRAAGGKGGAEHGHKGAEHGRKGGRPAKGKGGFETPLTHDEEPPPASASASAIPRECGGLSGQPTAPAPAPTRAGQACLRMRAAGLQAASPSHPKLLALLEAGITDDELADAAKDAADKGKPFAYALATAEGRRRDAAATSALPAAPAQAAPPSRDNADFERIKAMEAAHAARTPEQVEAARRVREAALAAVIRPRPAAVTQERTQ
jgi:hypothetical protein